MLNNQNLVNVRRQTVERPGFMTISPIEAYDRVFSDAGRSAGY